MIKEFKPALMFLGKFLAIYIVGNVLYGIFVESYGAEADPITRTVTRQTSAILNLLGYETVIDDHSTEPKIMIKQHGTSVLNVYEGCNGINVMIVFIAFLFAFGGPGGSIAWFLPVGIMIIHVINLVRIYLLFYLSSINSKHFYYYHKYFFTATLYLVVFALWTIWVVQITKKREDVSG